MQINKERHTENECILFEPIVPLCDNTKITPCSLQNLLGMSWCRNGKSYRRFGV